MRNKAINVLIEMGVPADIKGFQYIVDAMELFEDEKIKNGKITMLYCDIAEMHGTTAAGVERSIRHAFSVAITKGKPACVEKYLTMQNTSNGNLLHVLYLRLTQED